MDNQILQVLWLDSEIKKRTAAIQEWNRVSNYKNICDNHGANPINKLKLEIKVIESIKKDLIKIKTITNVTPTTTS